VIITSANFVGGFGMLGAPPWVEAPHRSKALGKWSVSWLTLMSIAQS
jgi:hypothetical protein